MARTIYGAVAIASLLMTGCTSYEFSELYPYYYEDEQKSKNGLIEPSELPGELVDALPLKFQLAKYTGHLWCFRDEEGRTSFSPSWLSYQKNNWSEEFTKSLKHASEDENYRVFTPMGYPFAFCVIPNVDEEQLFDETWFGAWLTFITTWETNELENEQLDQANKELAIQSADTSKLIDKVNNLIADYDKKIKETEDAIAATDSVINQRKSKLGMKLLGLDLDSKKDLPPFNPKIPYDKKKDPFLDVIKDGTMDVSGKPWATDQMLGGKYLDPELANKIDEINLIFAEPDKITNEKLKQDVIDLKASGFKGISVTSGARTPWRQSDLYSKAKKDGTPVGKYVRSEHMFGQATDMTIPTGWNWNSSSHRKLRSVMARLGIEMRVPNDPVHFTLTSPTRSFYARRLAMVRAYLAKATELKQAQGAVKENAIFDQERIIEQKAKVEADLQARTTELTNKTSLFNRISAAYLSKQRELQQLDAEIARREDEARRQAARDARHERGPREPHTFRRPEPNAPEVDRPEPPHRDPPPRDPPSRERPGGDGGSIRMPRIG